MSAVVISASLDRAWVKPMAALRSRGVACVVVAMDVPAFERREEEEATRRAGIPPVDEPLPQPSATAQEWRALRHALAEFDIAVYRVGPAVPLGEALAA
jgi:predicted TIM-barrel fold metal-dependent hydrolase